MNRVEFEAEMRRIAANRHSIIAHDQHFRDVRQQLPPAVRSIVCQVNELALTGLMTLVIDALRPSASTPLLLTYQRPF